MHLIRRRNFISPVFRGQWVVFAGARCPFLSIPAVSLAEHAGDKQPGAVNCAPCTSARWLSCSSLLLQLLDARDDVRGEKATLWSSD